MTHLNADVIQFLHAHKLPQILLRLNLAVLQSIVVLHAELIKGGAAITDSFFKLLHDGRMLLNEFLDSLDLKIDGQFDWCEKLADDVTNHSPRDVVKLVIKVGALQLLNSVVHLLHLVVAVFDHVVLALFHLLDFLELLQNVRAYLVLLHF